jgi:hypothetical protein
MVLFLPCIWVPTTRLLEFHKFHKVLGGMELHNQVEPTTEDTMMKKDRRGCPEQAEKSGLEGLGQFH